MLTLSADLQLTFVRLWITFCLFLTTLFFVVDLFRKPSNSDMALWLKQRILTNGNAFCFRLQTLVKSLTSQLWKKCQIELFSKRFYDIVPSLKWNLSFCTYQRILLLLSSSLSQSKQLPSAAVRCMIFLNTCCYSVSTGKIHFIQSEMWTEAWQEGGGNKDVHFQS